MVVKCANEKCGAIKNHCIRADKADMPDEILVILAAMAALAVAPFPPSITSTHLMGMLKTKLCFESILKKMPKI